MKRLIAFAQVVWEMVSQSMAKHRSAWLIGGVATYSALSLAPWMIISDELWGDMLPGVGIYLFTLIIAWTYVLYRSVKDRIDNKLRK